MNRLLLFFPAIIFSSFFVVACLSSEGYDGGNEKNKIPNHYYCEYEACNVNDLTNCPNDIQPKDIKCEFVEKFGCSWVVDCDGDK